MASPSRTRSQVARATKAAATRDRVLSAATALFADAGYLQTTMAEIASHADVAVQTLDLSFGSKVAILAAALDAAIAGDSEPVPLLDRPWFARVQKEPDGAAALGIYVSTATGIIDRHYPLYATIRASAAEPEVGELLARHRRLRFETQRQVVTALSQKPGFTSELSARQAAQIVFSLMSQETYGSLVVEHGWTMQRWSDWVRRASRG